MFSQRLDLIMEITGTTASALGRASLLDPSHVSRLRNGTRALPKNPAFLPAMSAYLAKRVTEEYQRNAMCGALRISLWPSDSEQAAALIEAWLLGKPEQTPSIEPLLWGFAAPPAPGAGVSGQTLPKAKSCYYGPKGKREAVLQFFDLILKEKSPQTLLLSSDEEMNWLYEDPDFAARWAAAFSRVLSAGNRVRIVHHIGRDLNELIEAISKWVPVYMTGMIEPYFYPKIRDGIFQRTLFIAPKTAAVISSSVMKKTEGMLNELVTDREAVAALTGEFEAYFSLCRPLMQILTRRDAPRLWQLWEALVRAEGELICMSGMPTLATMPDKVTEAIRERAPQSRVAELCHTGAAAMTELIKTGRYTELLREPDISPAELPLPCADLLGAPGCRYTAEEYTSHVEHAKDLAKAKRNYRIVTRKDIPQNVLLYAKEGRGLIIVKTDPPGVAFVITEPNLINTFWDYLAALIRDDNT